MPQVGFELTIPFFQPPKTVRALDYAVAVVGSSSSSSSTFSSNNNNSTQ
jgi:hypothetical protein